ncbi:MAG: hypothetical protein RLZ28_486 [Actinomycetota bacterium]
MRAWHRSITLYFALTGVVLASWMVRVPEIKTLTRVRTDELGLILLAGGLGALVALVASNRIIERFGTKPALVVGFSVFVTCIAAAGFSAAAHMGILVAVFLFVGWFGVGLADVAQNVDGSQLEQLEGRSLMPRLHASYSLGTLIGAGIGALNAAFRVALEWQMFAVLPLAAVLIALTYRHIPSGTGKVAEGLASGNAPDRAAGEGSTGEPKPAARQSSLRLLFGSNLLLLGLGIFAITLVEGASNDWLALALVDNYGASPANGGVGYACLVGAMTITRFFGGNLVDRWGRDVVLRRAAWVGVAGILVIILGQTWFGDTALYVAWGASALWGVGVALAFPLFLSAAGEGAESARRVALVATCGYTAFLVGPPALGFLGQSIGLLGMFWVLAGCLVVAAFVARGAKPQSHETPVAQQ